MKIHKRVLAGIMAVCVMGCMPVVNEKISPVVSMAESSETVKSGTCGENLTWVLDDKGILTISGTGDMEDYGEYREVDGVYLPSTPEWTFSIKKVIIEDGVTSIGNSAFRYCFNLKEITFPDSLTSIGDYAFCCCESLTSIEISDNVTSIGEGAFGDCIGLTSVKISDSVTNIGELAFSNCSSLTSVEIPDSVTNIEKYAFAHCSSLTSIEIPESVSSIKYAFIYCSELMEIIILNPDCEIGDDDSTISNEMDYDDLTGTTEYCFNGTIYGYENSTAQAYAEKHGYKFESLGKAPEKNTATGDMNGDKEFNISDVLTLQKYLLGGSDTEITDWKQADLNSDGVLDVFDLVLMRKKLIEK
ncbi:MAG: leucine-rich repeat protein [Ruminococcus sp.]|nr:leucine-rich repeat protein [Ruminococcus sp.]